MMVVGNVIVFDRHENVFHVHSQLESAGYIVGEHYVWSWYEDCYAAEFANIMDVMWFLIKHKD